MKSYSSKLISALLLLLSFGICSAAEEYEYGLHFETYPQPNSQYTGLVLENGKLFRSKGVFRMEFDLSNKKTNLFGTVFRIITDRGDNIDFMFTKSRAAISSPILVTGEQVTELGSSAEFDKWSKFIISIESKSGDITVEYNGTQTHLRDAGAKGAKGFRIAFGHCAFSGYTLDDVASFDIRDIKIFQNGKNTRHWELAVHDGDTCYDRLCSCAAISKNPHWLIDRYITLERIYSNTTNKEPSVAFVAEKGLFYICCDKSKLLQYNILDGSQETLQTSGIFCTNAPNQLVWDGEKLISYNLDDHSSSYFNPDRRTWIGTPPVAIDHDYWNNAAIWWPKERAIVSFGGYGHYHYNNTLSFLYPDNPEKDKQYSLEKISPRYSASIAIVDSLLYIFGGRGNPSGKQELSPREYYDLYSVNLRTMEQTKIYEVEDPAMHFVNGENMLYEKEKDCFYLFSYKDGGVLLKIGRTSPEFESISLPISENEDSQYTFRNLFLDKSRSKLYATSIKSQVDGLSNINIYRMNWPPVPMQLLHVWAEDPESPKESPLLWLYILGGILCVMAGGILWYLIARDKKKAAARSLKQKVHNEDSQKKYYDFSNNSICFFGGFCVKNRAGEDITVQFTPTIKSLIVLLLIHSEPSRPGISSNKLNRLLWSYKPEESANNNRNVYISKLRNLLEGLDGFTIVNKNKLWSMELSKGAQCDYLEALRLYREGGSEESVDRLLELLLRGMMLPNCEFEWLDPIKSDFSNMTIDFLIRQFEREDLPTEVKLRAADTIFKHDFLNEEALKAKYRLLYADGKTGLSKNVYDNFCKEYRASLGMQYSVSFKDIIEA